MLHIFEFSQQMLSIYKKMHLKKPLESQTIVAVNCAAVKKKTKWV